MEDNVDLKQCRRMSMTFSESLAAAVGTFGRDAHRVSDPVYEYTYTSGSSDHRIGGRIFFARIWFSIDIRCYSVVMQLHEVN